MTIDWEAFVSAQALQDSEAEGGFITPSEQNGDEGEYVPSRWGGLRELRQRLERGTDGLTDEERELLEEDFPEETT